MVKKEAKGLKGERKEDLGDVVVKCHFFAAVVVVFGDIGVTGVTRIAVLSTTCKPVPFFWDPQ